MKTEKGERQHLERGGGRDRELTDFLSVATGGRSILPRSPET